MSSAIFWGIFSFGFVFGYLLYYAATHTEKFNVDLLSSAIAAVGGGALVQYAQHEPGWIGPYGLGIGAGFVFYLILALILSRGPQTASGGLPLLRKTLLGAPNEPAPR